MSESIVVVDGVRTAIGRFGGGFVNTPAAELGAIVIREAVQRAGIEPSHVDQVVLGCVGQVAEDAYISRHAAVKAGIPIEVPAYNVNRLCGSGLEAITTGARWIQTGEADIVVAGGVENMSMLPYYQRTARYGLRMGNAELEDAIPILLSDPFNRYHMGITAENLAKEYSLTREEQDVFAVESHRRAIDAIESGRFADEIVPVEVKAGRETKVIDRDEHPRADSSIERMGGLKPAFQEGGSVTAGNASGINDGAAAVVLMSERKANELGLKPRLRLVDSAVAGVEPSLMGSGPIPATKKVLERSGVHRDDLDSIELNEAFAAVALACSRALEIDPARTNPNGGAVALGHPVGATGTILTVKLMNELARTGGKMGLVSLCIGGGQGISAIFENVS
ncbi:MAG: thiolase family protein [Dehalococcoidia bacterium]|nr:thiolase family protein [Dehalococcoidia bacterium]